MRAGTSVNISNACMHLSESLLIAILAKPSCIREECFTDKIIWRNNSSPGENACRQHFQPQAQRTDCSPSPGFSKKKRVSAASQDSYSKKQK